MDVEARFQIGDVKIPPRNAAGFIGWYQKCMHDAFSTVRFIKMLWNILEEEWIDILKWDEGSSLQCHILYCSMLHNLSEMKEK